MSETEAVARGRALLGSNLPGWRKLVNKYRLSMSHAQNCILGQIFGDYDRGLDALNFTRDDAVYYGFICEKASYDYDPAGEYTCIPCTKLAEAWRAVL